MTCTVQHTLGPNGGRTIARGSRPAKPCRWDVSTWFVLPSGEKHTHSLTLHHATLHDLVPAIGERIDDLIAEAGNEVASAGWTASGRGPAKRKR